MYNINYTTG